MPSLKTALTALLLISFGLILGYALSDRPATAQSTDDDVVVRWEYDVRCPGKNDAELKECHTAVGEEKTVYCPYYESIQAPADIDRGQKIHYQRGENYRCRLKVINEMGADGWEYIGQPYFTSGAFQMPFITEGSEAIMVFQRAHKR